MRFVMREFGMCVGGIKVLNEAFSPLSGDDGLEVWLLGEEGLYTIASSGMTVPELLCDALRLKLRIKNSCSATRGRCLARECWGN
jgi:hypothetical protein